MELKRLDAVTVAQLDAFDEVIDVRSPAEFALDHVPEALNCPVLDDAERAYVGTLYKQVSPFDAKKIGAALVSKNIAQHIDERFRGRDRGTETRRPSADNHDVEGGPFHERPEIRWKNKLLERTTEGSLMDGIHRSRAPHLLPGGA